MIGPTLSAPLVSIGMPVFNGEASICRALDSLLAQTFQNFELVISDNDSTDRTADLIAKYARLDSRIRHVRQSVNIGALDNFRAVFECAQGRYFLFAPHDDYWPPDFLAAGVTALDRHPTASCAMGEVRYAMSDGSIFHRDMPPYRLDADEAGLRVARYLRHMVTDNLIYGLWRQECLADFEWQRSFFPEKKLIMHMLIRGSVIDVPTMSYVNYYSFKTPVEVAESFRLPTSAAWLYKLQGHHGILIEILSGIPFRHLPRVLGLYLWRYFWLPLRRRVGQSNIGG